MMMETRDKRWLALAVVCMGQLVMIVDAFPDARERVRATAAYTVVSVAGGSIGLILGGLLTQMLDWHWIFFINLPLGILAFALGRATLARDEGIGLGNDVDVLGSFL